MKKEEYLLKKQQKEKERLHFIRRKKIKKAIFIFLPVIFIMGGIAFGLSSYSPKEASGTPKIEINPKEYDAGIVSMADGLVRKTYEIKNSGDGDLKIDNIRTSCDCTIAILKAGDKTSPEFGMHKGPIFWSQKIAPGETGFLEVIFDAAFHGSQGIGPAARAVYISSNDPQNKKAEARLIANVVK